MTGTIESSPDRLAQVERILAIRREEELAREAAADAQLNEHRRRLDRATSRFEQVLGPVLQDYATILREHGLHAEVDDSAADEKTPRLALRLAQPSVNGNGPRKQLEGCLLFRVAPDLARVSAREDTWRLLQGGSHRDVGEVEVGQLTTGWVEARVVAFLDHLLLNRTEAEAEQP